MPISISISICKTKKCDRQDTMRRGRVENQNVIIIVTVINVIFLQRHIGFCYKFCKQSKNSGCFVVTWTTFKLHNVPVEFRLA